MGVITYNNGNSNGSHNLQQWQPNWDPKQLTYNNGNSSWRHNIQQWQLDKWDSQSHTNVQQWHLKWESQRTTQMGVKTYKNGHSLTGITPLYERRLKQKITHQKKILSIFAMSSVRQTYVENPSVLFVSLMSRYCGRNGTIPPNTISRPAAHVTMFASISSDTGKLLKEPFRRESSIVVASPQQVHLSRWVIDVSLQIKEG